MSRRILLCGSGVVASLLIVPPSPQGELGLPIEQVPTVALLEFDTGACGEVTRVQTRNFSLNAVRATDRDESADDWVNAWEMSPAQSRLLNDWLSQHPEISTLTDAVEKSCDDVGPPIGDPDSSNIA